MGKNRQRGSHPPIEANQTSSNITNMSPTQLDEYIDEIKNMSDDDLMKTYQDFTSNWTYVAEWNGSKRTSKFIKPSEDITGDDGIHRGDVNNINHSFINLNRVRLEISTQMLKRDLDNEYGYPDVPYYEVIDGVIQFHPFTPTNE